MIYHHTKTNGDLAVLKAQVDLFEKGYMILLPQTEHSPFDLVVYKENQFTRVQVKYRHLNKRGCLDIKFSNSYSTKNGVQTKPVDKTQVDLYCVYCPETDKCYYFNPSLFGKSLTLRIEPTKNNQQIGVYYAQNYLEVPL